MRRRGGAFKPPIRTGARWRPAIPHEVAFSDRHYRPEARTAERRGHRETWHPETWHPDEPAWMKSSARRWSKNAGAFGACFPYRSTSSRYARFSLPLAARTAGWPAAAAHALGRILAGRSDRETVAVLERALRRGDEPLRWEAAVALCRLRRTAKGLPTLLPAFDEPLGRGQAVLELLEEIGPPAEAAAARLVGLRSHENCRVREAARRALVSIYRPR